MNLDMETYERIYHLATYEARKNMRGNNKSFDKTFNMIFKRIVNDEIERRKVKC